MKKLLLPSYSIPKIRLPGGESYQSSPLVSGGETTPANHPPHRILERNPWRDLAEFTQTGMQGFYPACQISCYSAGTFGSREKVLSGDHCG